MVLRVWLTRSPIACICTNIQQQHQHTERICDASRGIEWENPRPAEACEETAAPAVAVVCVETGSWLAVKRATPTFRFCVLLNTY